MTALNRHDMVWISHDGLQFAREYAVKRNPELAAETLEAVLIPGIPAIVSRQQEADEGQEAETQQLSSASRLWQVGFSSHLRAGGSRLRIAAAVPEDAILQTTTPFDAAGQLCRRDSKEARIVQELSALGKTVQLQVGIYGSLALGTLTGLPYVTAASDYDIWVSPLNGDADAAVFYRRMKRLEDTYGVRIDCEIDCDGYGVKLKELVSDCATVLGKGLYDASILNAGPYRERYFKSYL